MFGGRFNPLQNAEAPGDPRGYTRPDWWFLRARYVGRRLGNFDVRDDVGRGEQPEAAT
jgi:hypothetical protein